MDDVSHILEPLNDAQAEAVTAPADHALVLAGAGSGKTRVLVHRIAWLLAIDECMPHNILAVTFTNKAAGEMRGRIEAMLNHSISGMWVGTFHGLAHRLLRTHWSEAGLTEGFQILDSDDQLRALRRIMRELDIGESCWPPRQVQSFINKRKDEGYRARHIDTRSNYFAERMVEIYNTYETVCERSGLVDFPELLLRAHELIRDNPDILAHYRRRFSHILVDEFQDTNSIQYAWLRMLAGNTGALFCVGDDDQSIYGWRGARVENIHQFPLDYKNVNTLRLEQNYRSTGNILAAANGLIAHNEGRYGKDLWTDDTNGEPVHRYAAFNEFDEARFVAGRIQRWRDSGGRADEIAILYRVSAQSRVFEEALLAAGIAYRVHGGMRFYERAEIKDTFGYLRLMTNPSDDAAFERVVNTPPRGIGSRSVDAIRECARQNNCSLWQAALNSITDNTLNARAAKAIGLFIELIQSLAANSQTGSLAERIRLVIDESGLEAHFSKEPGERALARIENLNELITAAGQFSANLEANVDPMQEFLAHAALEAGDEQIDGNQDAVSLMTLHSAKGLEFPMVFLCGLEEGLFPHQRSSDDPAKLEEERRLCYVGMTRAKRSLYVTYAETRRLHRSEYRGVPSRFLKEMPQQHVEDVRIGGAASTGRYSPMRSRGSSNWTTQSDAGAPYQLGQRVLHRKFGEGIVTMYKGQGNQARVQVNFQAHGSKWLMASHAALQTV